MERRLFCSEIEGWRLIKQGEEDGEEDGGEDGEEDGGFCTVCRVYLADNGRGHVILIVDDVDDVDDDDNLSFRVTFFIVSSQM